MWREWVSVGALACVFLLLRVPGADLPLHQDEYKWPIIVNPEYQGNLVIPHPPLSEFIYQTAGQVVGYDTDFRYVPLLFGFCNLFLLYYFLRRYAGIRAAVIGGVLFTLSYYSVLASLMVDTDGQIMPFFFLLALIAYDRMRQAPDMRRVLGWGAATALALLGGLLVKISFALAVGAFVLDFLWSRRHQVSARQLATFGVYGAVAAALVAVVLFLSHYVFAFFDLSLVFTYATRFMHVDRNWFQTLIQVVKALLYLSPLLVLTPFFPPREHVQRLLPSLIYIGAGFLFYVVLFDFSVGALDRYFEFLIIPLVILTAVTIDANWSALWQPRSRAFFALGCLAAVLLVLVQFVPHFVPPLHPKSEWIGRILSLRWNFLYPFSGGSGPLTFYVSFIVLGVTWGISGLLWLWGVARRDYRAAALALLIPVAAVYAGIFTEEYLIGAVNGSAAALVERSAAYIAATPDIQQVIVYNDNGGNEIRATGKYFRRMYAVPEFSAEYVGIFNSFKGHYLVIDAPPLDPTSVYARYLSTCVPVHTDTSAAMTATVYDCRSAPAFAP